VPGQSAAAALLHHVDAVTGYALHWLPSAQHMTYPEWVSAARSSIAERGLHITRFVPQHKGCCATVAVQQHPNTAKCALQWGAQCAPGPDNCCAGQPPSHTACRRTCAGAGAAACCGVPFSEGPHAALGPSMLSASARCCGICCRHKQEAATNEEAQSSYRPRLHSFGWAGTQHLRKLQKRTQPESYTRYFTGLSQALCVCACRQTAALPHDLPALTR
jgi:hypothetical protein